MTEEGVRQRVVKPASTQTESGLGARKGFQIIPSDFHSHLEIFPVKPYSESLSWYPMEI